MFWIKWGDYEAYQQTKMKDVWSNRNMNFDKTNLLQEVQSYNEGSTINYSSLAKKYNICNKAGQPGKNGGQIFKEFLKEQQVNVKMFRYNGKGRHTCNTDTKQSWKRKIKVQGGYSVPCDESIMKAKERLQKDIEDEKYCLGEVIVAKEYKKMVIKNNQVTEEIFTIYGRKIPLTKIRKKLLQNEVKYLWDPPDFDDLESTDLMKIFQDVIGKPVESVSEAKKRAPVTVTHSSPSSLAWQFYHCK